MNNNGGTRTKWHTTPVEDIFALLGTEEQGLSNAEVSARLQKYGENKLPDAKQDSLVRVFLRQFQSPLIYLLIAAAGAVLLVGEVSDTFIILAVLVFNAIAGTIQEGRAQNTLASLRKFVETRATVLREGKEEIIPDGKIVPGDILIMQEGERVPADARLITVRNFRVDEAALTGESIPVHKITEALHGETLPVADRRNMIFKGTHVATGTSRALVVGTGLDTEIGLIAREIVSLGSDVPLKANIESLARLIIFVATGISISLFILGIIMGKAAGEMFLTVVSLLVSIVPEGLPIVLTLVLATGVWRMGKRNALVKKMHAVEALGQVDILAVDKTGTLTKNEMVVQKVYTDGKFFEISGIGYEPHGDVRFGGDAVDPANHPELLFVGKTSALCANARVLWSEENDQWNLSGDPTEVAMLVLSQKLGFHKDILEQESPMVAETPFDYTLKYHAVLNKVGDTNVLSLAGAPEIILDLCTTFRKGGIAINLGASERNEIESVLVTMSKDGLRVIALATFSGSMGLPSAGSPPHATFIGFLAMRDALRPEVASTVARARDAGIRTVMITGDHRITAEAIANEAGIYRIGDAVLTGGEVDLFSDKELANTLATVSVFARVTPEHKLRIIRAYKGMGHIIAMTGDGVNDAPSLTAADLGVAMGRVGTEVAKEASDIVLLDDNMNSIIAAIEEGRSIYKTIKKVILYLFSTSAGEVLTIAGAIILGYMAPILPAQIIWLNFVTDGFLDTALAMEPKERGLLSGPRSKESRRLVDRLMVTRMVVMASTMAIGTLYLFGGYATGDPAKAWTISLTLLAVFQWFNAWNCRSERFSILQMNPFSNLFLVGATGIVVALQVGALYTALGQKLLHTVPLSLSEWGIIIVVASSIIIVEEVRKLIHRTRKNSLHIVAA
mgnify:CR=1 FL=1